jgi:hypothetical protein
MNIYDYFKDNLSNKYISTYITEIPSKYIFNFKTSEKTICILSFYKNKIDRYGNKINYELYIDRNSIYYRKKIDRKYLKMLIYKYLEKKICKKFTIDNISKLLKNKTA